jgi:methyl-accepting chemotaxis protein
MAQHYKRRNIFIKKDFQGKLILGYFLFVAGGCLLFILLLGFFSADSMTISYNNHDLQLGQTPIVLLKKVLAAHWVFLVLGSVFLVITAMFITHRIAGPLFRFEKALDNMLEKRLDDTIFLRSKDEGKDLAKKINAFNEDLSISLKNLQAHSEAIAGLLEQARTKTLSLSPAELNDLQGIYWSMDEKNKRIKVICSAYTLKDV